MIRTTPWFAWLLFGLTVTASGACGGDKGGGAGSGGAGSGGGGSEARPTGGAAAAQAGAAAAPSGRSGSGAAAGRGGASGVGGAGAADDGDAGMEPDARAGSGGAAANGGAPGNGGASGSGGAAGSVGSFGNGGASGDVDDSDSAGAGGMSGSGGASESGGASGSAGASGSGGSGGEDGEDGDESAAQCVRDAEAAGQTITDCETCLCMSDKCQAEMNAIKDDVNANALATCGKANACAGQCCLCSTDGQGDTCGIQNYATGVCADEVEIAAGAMPGAGLLNVGAVMTNCANAGPADNACARVTRLETCAAAKCASECPRVAVPCP